MPDDFSEINLNFSPLKFLKHLVKNFKIFLQSKIFQDFMKFVGKLKILARVSTYFTLSAISNVPRSFFFKNVFFLTFSKYCLRMRPLVWGTVMSMHLGGLLALLVSPSGPTLGFHWATPALLTSCSSRRIFTASIAIARSN